MITINKDFLDKFRIILPVFLVIGVFMFLFTLRPEPQNLTSIPVSYSEGSQTFDLTAKGGFSPNIITAAANKQTYLKVITNKTFDCSSSIRIPSLNISQNLPLSGETIITLGVHQKGEVVDGTCLMGMYSFKVQFI